MDFTDPAVISDSGKRCVLEVNWSRVDGPRCQMIWQWDRDGLLVTTCDPQVPDIRVREDQAATLAYFLRQVPGSGS